MACRIDFALSCKHSQIGLYGYGDRGMVKNFSIFSFLLVLSSCSKQSCFDAAFSAAHAHAAHVCPSGRWEDCPEKELIESELDAALRVCQEVSE